MPYPSRRQRVPSSSASAFQSGVVGEEEEEQAAAVAISSHPSPLSPPVSSAAATAAAAGMNYSDDDNDEDDQSSTDNLDNADNANSGDDNDDDNDENYSDQNQQLPEFTRVDGRGLWRSWKRNFKTKMLALLDLIDNSLDAAIPENNVGRGDKGGNGNDNNADDDDEEEEGEGFVGRVHIYPDDLPKGKGGGGGGARPAPSAVPSAAIPAAVPSTVTSSSSRYFRAPDLVFSNGNNGGIGDDGSDGNDQIDSAASTNGSSNNNRKKRSANSSATGLCIVNNSVHPIRPLVRVLEVYNSSKIHSGMHDIGENGVGLKQGCATLSDLSFVLVKNGRDNFVELGVIAESLQMIEGCYLPAFRFNLDEDDNDDDDDSAIRSLKVQMTALFLQPQHRNVAHCIERYGSAMPTTPDGEGGNEISLLERGIDRLCVHFRSTLDFFSSRYVFAVIMHDVNYGKTGDGKPGDDNINRRNGSTADPIKDLRAVIPRTYLHVPETFDFRIGGSRMHREKVVFKYWPQRLVELSSFTVGVNPDVPWHSSGADERGGTYRLRVFLGFDRLRIHEDAKACSLLVYSRQSGRLIKFEPDARFMLGLNASGSMYCSGLTVIVDDVEGRLPLNPTKQDVAFGEQANGEVHKSNLYAWVASVTKFFYEYHLAKFNNKKMILTAKIKEFGIDLVRGNDMLRPIDEAELTTFNAQFKFYAKRSIRIEQRTAAENPGRDTRFRLVADPPSPPPSPLPPVALSADAATSLRVRHEPPAGGGERPERKRRRVDEGNAGSPVPILQVTSDGMRPIDTRGGMPQDQQQAQQPPTAPAGRPIPVRSGQPIVPPTPQQPWPPQQQSYHHHPHHQQQQYPMSSNPGHPQFSQADEFIDRRQAHFRSMANRHVEQLQQQVLHQQQPQPQPVPSGVGVPHQVVIGVPSQVGSIPPGAAGAAPPAARVQKEVEVIEIDLTDSDVEEEKDDTTGASASAEVSGEGVNVKDEEVSMAHSMPTATSRSVTEEPSDAEAANNEEEEGDDDDDESAGSTKDYYKNLCEKLLHRLEKRKEVDHKLKAENKRLKEEIETLREEKQVLLLNGT